MSDYVMYSACLSSPFLCDPRGTSPSGAVLICVMLGQQCCCVSYQSTARGNMTHISIAPLGLDPLGSQKKEPDVSTHAL